MALTSRVGDLDARAWAAATWAVPFITQVLLVLVIGAWWLFGKLFAGANDALLFLAGAAVVLVMSAAATAALLRSRSPRAKGLGLAVAAAYVVVLIGGLIYGFWVIRW